MDDGVGSLTWTSSTIKVTPDQLTLTNAQADICTHLGTHIYTNMQTYIHTCMCAHTCMCKQAQKSKYMQHTIFMQQNTNPTHALTDKYTHICITQTYAHKTTHTYMHAHTHTHTHTHINTMSYKLPYIGYITSQRNG